MIEEDTRESVERAFQSYSRPLVTVTSFKYLVWVLTATDDNCPEVVEKVWKARKIWARMEMILIQEGASPRVSGMFSKEVVQAVLLFRSETWVMNPRMGRALGIFQHRFARRIAGRNTKLWVDGSWEYPPVETEME